jgi:hypothetical protein
MVMGRGWYVKGTKLAWPNGTRLCSGPFDDHGAAFAEMRRIRPFYPDATLDVVLHRAHSLPMRNPRTSPQPQGPLIVAATGHRWQRMDIERSPAAEARLVALARSFLMQLQPDKAISGLALGWDTAWAIAAVELRIPLIVCMPGKRGQQEARWDFGDQGTHEWLVRQSVEHSWIGGDLPFPKACLSRDEYMVERASLICALWSGEPSGTGKTVAMAHAKQVGVVNLWGLHRP